MHEGKTEVVFVSSSNENVDTTDFFRRVYTHPELSRDFMVSRMSPLNLGSVVREWVVDHGVSSLFYHHITCDAVMHPGITADKIEELILGFVRGLAGVKNLYIIDQYFYSMEQPVVSLFEAMLRELSPTLESVTFFTKAFTRPSDVQRFDSAAMHAALRNAIPSVVITEVKTDVFHDRFWIDADAHKGIVMGTSLNGINKKYALIDHLRRADAKELADAARAVV